MDARELVVDLGDRITTWGRIWHDDEGDWVDQNWVNGLILTHRRGPEALRLIGADLTVVPTEFGPGNQVPGMAVVTGRWLGEVIDVESMAAGGPGHNPIPEYTTPPCPPPAGGWPRSDDNPGFVTAWCDPGDLEATGAAVAIHVYHPEPDQSVIVATAADVAAVEAVLRPQLGDRLCAVPSRCTRAQLDAARAGPKDAGHAWEKQASSRRDDDHAQCVIDIYLRRVTAEIADWAETFPDGMIEFHPLLTPRAS